MFVFSFSRHNLRDFGTTTLVLWLAPYLCQDSTSLATYHLKYVSKDVCLMSLGAQLKRIVKALSQGIPLSNAKEAKSVETFPPASASASEMTPARSNSARSAPAETCEKAEWAKRLTRLFGHNRTQRLFPTKALRDSENRLIPASTSTVFSLSFFFPPF